MTRVNVGWHQENIKAEIKKRFGSLKRFADNEKISKQSVSSAISSPIKSSLVELKIAAALEVSPHVLWPDRWTPDDKKIDRTAYRRAKRAAA